MSFNYKNPITPLSSIGPFSVPRNTTFGTNFSVLSVGGYMEVYSINDLLYTIPSGTTGIVEYSGNIIPIQLNIGSGSIFSPNVLTLNSDNISSGRRRLGMLVYVIEDDQIYQYQIPNFESLWNSVTGATGPGGQTVTQSEFGTTIKSNSPEGISFISAWTANTIEGISGETSSTAVWKKLSTGGGTFTGGTVTGDTIFLNGLTANTFSASTYLGLPADIYITGGTFNSNTETLTLERSSGSTIVITGFTDYYTTGATLAGDTLFFNRNDLYSAYSVNLPFLPISGGTIDGNLIVTGNTSLQGVTATTISATTYQNLPLDIRTTGATYSNNTITFTNNTGGTYSVNFNTVSGWTVNGNLIVTGNTSLQSLTATTISATTYLNLPTDIRVTGGTYSNGTATFTNNTGGTFTVTGLTVGSNYLPLSGGTVTGNTIFTSGFTGNTGVFSSSTQNALTVVGSGTTSPIFKVIGSQGELFSVTDSLTGSLFAVNDISGLPILEVFSDTTTLMGSYLAPSLNTTVKVTANSGTTNIYSIPTSAYTGAFFDYTITDSSNARAGNIMTIFSGTSVQYTETSTLDIGTTTGVTFSVVISSGNAILRSSATTNNWVIKTIIRSI